MKVGEILEMVDRELGGVRQKTEEGSLISRDEKVIFCLLFFCPEILTNSFISNFRCTFTSMRKSEFVGVWLCIASIVPSPLTTMIITMRW